MERIKTLIVVIVGALIVGIGLSLIQVSDVSASPQKNLGDEITSFINTNYLALISQNNLSKSQSPLGSAIERLSSGIRKDSAIDAAAGQAIANRFTYNVRGLTEAFQGANDGLSIAQLLEDHLNEINDHLLKMRELQVQSSGNPSQTDLASIKEEIKNILEKNDAVMNKYMPFSSHPILDNFQSNFETVLNETRELQSDIKSLMNESTITIEKIDDVLNDISELLSSIVTLKGTYQSTVVNLNNTINNLGAARSRIEDAQYGVDAMSRQILPQINERPALQTTLSLLR